MIDGYTTTDQPFAAILCYIFSQEALIEIEIIDFKPHMTLDVPSLDAAEYLNEFQSGTLACSDAQALFKAYRRILGAIRTMRQNKQDKWTSPAYASAWRNGAWPDGRRIK